MKSSIQMVIKDLFAELGSRNLTESQSKFIEGAKRYFKRNKILSEKQLSTLLEIKRYANQ
jgi:hypothetical protein